MKEDRDKSAAELLDAALQVSQYEAHPDLLDVVILHAALTKYLNLNRQLLHGIDTQTN